MKQIVHLWRLTEVAAEKNHESIKHQQVVQGVVYNI